MGLRPSEARALDVADLRDGYLTISKGAKTQRTEGSIRGTKTRKIRRLPIAPEVQAWIDVYVKADDRLRGAALFRNPDGLTDSKRWSPAAIRRVWIATCRKVGVRVGLYEGTKHAFATNAVARGVEMHKVQKFLGHADKRTTERYAKLSDRALLSVLRRGKSAARKPNRIPAQTA